MIITIARQCGCGALEVGKILSQNYDIPLYTRNSLQEAAISKGMLPKMEDFFEERPVDELMSAITFSFERDDVQEKFCRTFRELIGEKDCIVIGRCGNFIFRNRDDLVSVLLQGEQTDRVSNQMTTEEANEKEEKT